MFHLSRSLYREIAPNLAQPSSRGAHERVLRACERTIERLVTDHHYFANPSRTLFQEIRFLFPMSAQKRVWQLVQLHVEGVARDLQRDPFLGQDLTGTPPACQATTRRGAPCQRDPLPGSRYCPSHQHLAETEEVVDHDFLTVRAA